MKDSFYRSLSCLFTFLVTLSPFYTFSADLPIPEKEKPLAACLIEDVPHIVQKPDFCGEACVAMFLQRLGHQYTQDDVFNLSGLDPVLGRGSYTKELKAALEKIGFDVGEKIFNKLDADKADKQMDLLLREIVADIKSGYPSIVCMHYSEEPGTTEHFRLIIGYAPKSDSIIYQEPAEENGSYREMSRKLFFRLWPLKYSEKEWTAIRFRLNPGKIRQLPKKAEGEKTNADFAQHIMRLKKDFPSRELTYVVERPFVVVGNESPSDVRRRSSDTVRWAVKRLKDVYFDKDPKEIITIWLMGEKKSYEELCKKIEGQAPDTPYGFYSDTKNALIMNIATGGGTLVHEIVHPFIKANFPECPSWLNEGLGSLYEQCDQKDGKIVGRTNWRLAGLQEEIKMDGLPSFKELTGYDTSKFYNNPGGDNYAQSRYLCYYLQEKGLLFKFYKEFYQNRKEDPTGYSTMQKILDVNDMDKFKKEWEAYVMELKFP